MTSHPEIGYTDVTVIGAGIAGLTTAYWLKQDGKEQYHALVLGGNLLSRIKNT